MAALTSSITSFHDQKDLRSASKPFKRDRELTSKWAFGVRGHDYSHDHRTAATYGTLTAEERAGLPANYRERPKKSFQKPTHKSHANTRTGTYSNGKASNRLSRKADISHDSHSSNVASLSQSLLDLLPATAHNHGNARTTTSAKDGNNILYSFDATSSPNINSSRQAVGLSSLVDRAEREWAGRETDRIVKKEWEVLDDEGESVAARRAKGKGKGVVKGARTVPAVVGVDEDEWECV